MADLMTNAQLAQLINDALAKWNAREAEQYAWVSGSATGGPNGDGRFPLSNGSGSSNLIDSPAKLADLLNGPAALAGAARDEAQVFRDAAQSAATAASTDKTLANNSKLAAQDARDLAMLYRDQTAALQATVSVSEAAVAAALASVTTKEANVITLHGETLVARDDAVVAKTAAEAAAALAATFNPNDYYTKVAADGRYLQLTNFTWSNLSGKPSTFAPSAHTHLISEITGLQAALDSKQAAGSYAAAVHSHVIGDVTGLQAALDGKQAAGSYAATVHTHVIGDVSGLQAALDGKASISHTHSYLPLSGGVLTGQLKTPDLQVEFNSGTSWSTMLSAPWDNPVEVLNMNVSGFAAITFHVANKYANLFGYDENNVLKTNNSTIWHSGNFDPNSKLDLSGGTLSGQLIANGYVWTSRIGYNPSGDVFNISTTTAANYGMSLGEFNGNGNGLCTILSGYSGLHLATTGLPRLSINSSGNVTVGNTASYGRLASVAADGTYQLALVGTTKGLRLRSDSTNFKIEAVDQTLSSSYEPMWLGGSLLQFTTGNVERMRLTAAGNLGIGTQSPSLPLVISNGGASGLEFNHSGAIGGGTYIQSYNRATSVYVPNTNYALSHTWYAGATRAMDMDGSGNLALGKAAPAEKLDVNGAAIRVNNVTTLFGNTYSVGNLQTWLVTNASSADTFIQTGDIALRYRQNSGGGYQWQRSSTTGTANGSITWQTQMTLDTSGRLTVASGDIFVRENPAGAGVGMRLHHNGGSAYIDYDGDLNFRTGDGGGLASLSSSGSFVASSVTSTGDLRVGGYTSATGFTILNNGSSSNPGYLSWYNPAGTRVGYMGWASGSNIVYQAEAGWGLVFNSTTSFTSTSSFSTTVNIAGGNLRINSHDNDSNMGAYIGFRNPVNGERGWIGFGENTTRMRVRNAIGDIWVHGTTVNLYSDNSGGQARIQNSSGYVDIGAINTSWCHYITDRPAHYFGNPVHVNGAIMRYNEGAALHHGSSSLASGRITTSTAAPSGGSDGDVWFKVAS